MVTCMESQYFACSQAAVEIALLGHDGNALPDTHGISDDINSCDTCCAAGRKHIGGQDSNGGCLARSVWSQQAEDFTRWYSERNAVNSVNRRLRIALDEFMNLDGN